MAAAKVVAGEARSAEGWATVGAGAGAGSQLQGQVEVAALAVKEMRVARLVALVALAVMVEPGKAVG